MLVPKSPSKSLVASPCSVPKKQRFALTRKIASLNTSGEDETNEKDAPDQLDSTASGSIANVAEQDSTVGKCAKIIDVSKDSFRLDSADTIIDLENEPNQSEVNSANSENKSSRIQVGHLDNGCEDEQRVADKSGGRPSSGTATAPPLLNQVQHLELNEAPAVKDGQDLDETPTIEVGQDSDKILSVEVGQDLDKTLSIEVGPATSDKAASQTHLRAAKRRGTPPKPKSCSSRKTSLSEAEGNSSDSPTQILPVIPCTRISKNFRDGGKVSKPKNKLGSSPTTNKNCSPKKICEIVLNDDIVLRRSPRSVTSLKTLNKSVPLEPHVEVKTTFPKSGSKRRSTNCRTAISLSDVDPSLSRHLTTSKRFSPVKKSLKNVKSLKNAKLPNDTTSSKNFNSTKSPSNPAEKELKRVS